MIKRLMVFVDGIDVIAVLVETDSMFQGKYWRCMRYQDYNIDPKAVNIPGKMGTYLELHDEEYLLKLPVWTSTL